jgi:2-aminoadipate transaminase
MKSPVERIQRVAAARNDMLSFAGGLPDPEAFPRAGLTRAFLRAIAHRGAPALQYGWPEGRPALREFIAKRLCARGCSVGADDVVVTSGAQQAIAIATQLIFRRSKTIRLDPETYSGALELFRARGLDITLDPYRARGAYVMPQIGNPSGQKMDAVLRRELVRHARRRKLWLIEDDAYADITFTGQPGPPLLAEVPESTFHIGTFSKNLCPGLRVGWLVAPRRFREPALDFKRENDLQANSLAQSILEEFFAQDDFEARMAKARRLYRRRAARLADALRHQLPDWTFEDPKGGFSIWVDTGAAGDDIAFLRCALAQGTSFDPGSLFRVGEGSTLTLRLSYSCLPEASIEEAVQRLAAAWRSLVRGPRARDRKERARAARRREDAEKKGARLHSGPSDANLLTGS